MNALSIFNYQNTQVRTVMVDGEPWFVAKDVAEILGYRWKRAATVAHIPEEWRGSYSVGTPSGEQEMLMLSEQGLYYFLARSDKPLALPFQKWIAGEVLPSIRKTGAYLTAPASDALGTIMAELATLRQQLAAPTDPKLLIAQSIAANLPNLSPAVQKIVVTTALALPAEAQSTWTATQICGDLAKLGIVVSAQKLGKVAGAHGIKCPLEEQENEFGFWSQTSVNSFAKVVNQFLYRKPGRDRLIAILSQQHAGAC